MRLITLIFIYLLFSFITKCVKVNQVLYTNYAIDIASTWTLDCISLTNKHHMMTDMPQFANFHLYYSMLAFEPLNGRLLEINKKMLPNIYFRMNDSFFLKT